MKKRMRLLNLVSAVAFFISSASILFIPFLDTESENKVIVYMIALFFWTGLLSGTLIQIFLKIKCQKMKWICKSKSQNWFYLTAVIFLIICIFLSVIKSKNYYIAAGSLSCTFISVQAAVIIKRRGCLK